MKRTLVAREVATALQTTEASIGTTLAHARATLERLTLAKRELGLTGKVGDEAIDRVKQAVEALEQAEAAVADSHAEAYRVMKLVNIRTEAGWMCPQLAELEGQDRVA